VQQRFETPRVGTLLSTACSFVGSLYRGPKAYVPGQLVRLLPWVISILQSLPGISLSPFLRPLCEGMANI
jgi:hypothetical protein